MKANELRIGNYVQLDPSKNWYPKTNGIKEVESITETGINREAYEYDFYELEYYDIKPIPLTEEWLLKFGFDSEMICEEDRDRIISKDSFFMYKGTFQHILTGVILKHVHQLQNLYFALTGEELKLDKPQ